MGVGICLSFTGCVMLGGLTKSDLEAIYGRIEPHWIGPVRPIRDVLELGFVQDPATTGGQIVPVGEGNLGEPRWLSQVGLDHVRVFIRPTGPTENTWNFGPKIGSSTGVYLFQVHDADDARCAEYNDAMIEAARFNSRFHAHLSPPVQAGKCITYSYEGQLNIKSNQWIHIYWFDESLKRRGSLIRVEEMRYGPHEVVARAVSCSVVDAYPWQPEGCPGNNDLMALFNKVDGGSS